MRDPSHLIQARGDGRRSSGEREWRAAVQRRVAARLVVVNLEFSQLPFQVSAVPEQHIIEEFTPHRSNQALDERV